MVSVQIAGKDSSEDFYLLSYKMIQSLVSILQLGEQNDQDEANRVGVIIGIASRLEKFNKQIDNNHIEGLLNDDGFVSTAQGLVSLLIKAIESKKDLALFVYNK